MQSYRIRARRKQRAIQAQGLGWAQIQLFLKTAGEGLRATRERALLCVAYDTLARRGELVALTYGDLKFLADGSGRVLIRRSKTDQSGQGHVAYLAPLTVRYLREWLQMGQIQRGALFRRLIGTGLPAQAKPRAGRVPKFKELKDRIGARLGAGAISVIFKSVARHIRLPPDDIAKMSGHSIRAATRYA